MYEYIETESMSTKPKGEGWQYWGQLVTNEDEKSIWKRDL